MDENKMIDDLINMLDSGMAKGVGHVNVDCDEEVDESKKCSDNGLYGLFQNTVGLQCPYS